MRGHRGDFPAASAPGTHARRAQLPGALEDRARPGLVGEREWLCGSAPPLPTRAAEPPRPSAPQAPGGSPRARARLPAASPHPARASASRVTRGSKAPRAVPPPRAHTCRAARRPAPAPAPPRGTGRASTRPAPAAAGAAPERYGKARFVTATARQPAQAWAFLTGRPVAMLAGVLRNPGEWRGRGSNGVQAGGEFSHPWLSGSWLP